MSDDVKLPSEIPQGSGITYEIARFLGAVLTVVCLAWNLDVLGMLGTAVIEESFQAMVLGLGLGIIYLTYNLAGGSTHRLTWYDALLSFTSIAVLTYVSLNFLRLKEDGYSNSTQEVIVLGTIISLLVLEGLRRSAGFILLCVVMVFMIYAPLAHLVPGPLVGLYLPPWQIAVNMGFNPNAIFGLPLDVSTTIVVMFILMGQVLFKAGGGEFFTDLAMATMGRRRGGSAKISVVASGLFGTISGTAVSNVVTTGIITIPLMRRSGYSGVQAGAIEAIASTGGQLMPPIMGAAAFLMAEFLEIPYSDIIIAALIPALLYYFAVFIQVDLIAARDNITFIDQDMPRLSSVLARGWYLALPFVVLIYALFVANQRPSVAAIYATGALVVLGLVFSYGGRRISLRDLYEVLVETGLIVSVLFMIVAASGLVIGVLNMTGLGLALPSTLLQMAGGQLWAVLLIAAVVSIILGMGMPTTAVYILLAAMIAPAIVQAGIEPLPAHMFIFYFGMMSMITPPIALAAFAAATLTKADPMRTGFEAVRLGWVAFIIPFLFVLSPSLLLNGPAWYVALNVITATAGTYFISVGMVGYFTRRLGFLARLLLVIGGAAALVPDTLLGAGGLIDLSGTVLGTLVLIVDWALARRKNKVVATD